jgi:hypothetical protein
MFLKCVELGILSSLAPFQPTQVVVHLASKHLVLATDDALTCIHPSVHPSIPTQNNRHLDTHTHTHTHTHTYIHTHIHTYIHTYIHTQPE